MESLKVVEDLEKTVPAGVSSRGRGPAVCRDQRGGRCGWRPAAGGTAQSWQVPTPWDMYYFEPIVQTGKLRSRQGSGLSEAMQLPSAGGACELRGNRNLLSPRRRFHRSAGFSV